MSKGVATVFHPNKPRLEFEDMIFPMDELGIDEQTGYLLCSITLKLSDSSGVAMRAVSADIGHRRGGHLNSKSLDILRRASGNGVDCDGAVTS